MTEHSGGSPVYFPATVERVYDAGDGGAVIEVKVVTAELLKVLYQSNHPITGLPCLAVNLKEAP